MCSKGRPLTIAHSQCPSSDVLGVPFIFSLIAAFIEQLTPPHKCKIKTLQRDSRFCHSYLFAPVTECFLTTDYQTQLKWE